ncbi:hypothetical protein MASR1M48_16420 [Lactococcus petauri]
MTLLHLRDLPQCLEDIRKTAQTVSNGEIEFLRIFEELLYMLLKKELNIELRRTILEVLDSINKAQVGALKAKYF